MAQDRLSAPRHKVKEKRGKKTVVDKLKGSAMFLLVIILAIIAGVVNFIFWISSVLRGDLLGWDMFTSVLFIIFMGVAVFLTAFFTWAYVVQKRAYG